MGRRTLSISIRTLSERGQGSVGRLLWRVRSYEVYGPRGRKHHDGACLTECT